MRRAVAATIILVPLSACVIDRPVAPSSTPSSIIAPSLALSAAAAAPANRYLVAFRANGAAIADEVAASGGRLEGLHENLGFAVVSGLSAEAAGRLRGRAGITAVEADIEFAIEPLAAAEAIDISAVEIQSATAPQTASQYFRQWNMRAVFANTAWAAGRLGSSDVTVAILDTGIDYLWPDLAGRVDLSRSVSLRPDEDERFATWFPGSTRHPVTDLHTHGTLVATVVASNSNFFAGVTTRTTLIGVKVCTMFDTCSTSAILNGIVHAVDHGADVINMSLGGAFLKRANPGFVSVINSVFSYANRRGALIVVAAGNNAADIDHTGNVYFTYCDSPHVVCVSATGPTAAPTAGGPFTNPDAVAAYTNFGRSAISLAAPGGGTTTANAFVTGPCSSTRLAWHQPPPEMPGGPLPPRVIDGPACPLPGLFLVRGAGTSFSAPHVAGAAAQIIAQIGPGRPAQVRDTLQRSADDLGQPGTDPFYGKGRLNVARAVGLE